MTYDQWKCTDSNEPYYDEEEEYCDHNDYEIDIVSGEWSCAACGEHRSATLEEVEMMCRHMEQYAEYEASENRRQWWRDRTYPVRMFLHRILMRIWPRKSLSVLTDDEIPF